MIIDRIENIDAYTILNSKFKKVCKFLLKTSLIDLPIGKHKIDGDDIFLIIEEKYADEKASPLMEAHEKYIDVQYCFEGSFSIGYKNISFCKEINTEYDEKKDIIFYNDKPDFIIENNAGQFVILFPWDAHLIYPPKISVKKAIFKVKYE